MLHEQIHYYKNLNFAIDFSNVAEEAPHYHKETEMALVLRGSATYRIHHQEFHLKTGDAIVVDTKDLHYITESSEDVIMLTFHINMEAFTDIYPNIDFMIFACEEFSQGAPSRHQKMQNRISFLIHHMAQMMFLRENENTEDHLMTEKLQEILYLMVNHFQGFFIENREFRSGNEDATPAELDRLYRIVTYMYQNYDKKLTLQEVAEMEHLSIYYASHLIKRLSGLSFQNLLNYIRVESSEKLLNDNKYTLTQISEFCGFSSPAYYNKCFESWHGMTPAQYCKQVRPKSRSFHKPFERREALFLLEAYLNADLPQQPEGESRFSAQHIFLPIQSAYTPGMPFREAFPLALVLDTSAEMAELINLPFLPDSVSNSSEASLFPPIDTVAKAFEYIQKERHPRIRYKGKTPALLSANGSPTPFYALYKLLSGIDGTICDQQKQYVLIRDDRHFTLILFNTGDAEVHVHLQFNQNNRPDYMIKKVFPCLDLPADIPPVYRLDLLNGNTEFLDEIETELTVAVEELVVLVF